MQYRPDMPNFPYFGNSDTTSSIKPYSDASSALFPWLPRPRFCHLLRLLLASLPFTPLTATLPLGLGRGLVLYPTISSAIALLLDLASYRPRLLLHTRHHAAGSPAHRQEGKFRSVRQGARSVLLALPPAVIEQPLFGELCGVAESIYGGLADVKDRRVQLFQLCSAEYVAVLLRVQLGMIQDLIPTFAR